MPSLITITLSVEEAEIILAALDTDCEIYQRSAWDAGADGSHDLAARLSRAAARIYACRTRLERELAKAGG